MSDDVVIGVKLKGDGSGLVGEVARGRDELGRFSTSARQAGDTANTSFRATTAGAGLAARAMAGLRAAADEASGRMAGMASSLGVAGRALAALGPVGLVVGAVFAATTAAAVPMVKAFAESERAAMRLEAQLKATGNATGLIREEIEQLADELNDTTIFDDDQAREAIAALTVFGKVHGDVFRDAIKVAADYAAATGRDLPAATEIIGRALQEPAEGLGALNRQLRLFDDEAEKSIKRMVEAGDAEKARIVILDALKDRFNGVAGAMRGGVLGAAGELSKALGNLAEDVGGKLAKALNIEGLLQKMADAVNATRKALAPTNPNDQLTALQAKRDGLDARLKDPSVEALTKGQLAELQRSFAEADKRLGELKAAIGEAKRLREEEKRAAASTPAANERDQFLAETDAKIKALDPLVEQTEKLEDLQQRLKRAIELTGDPLGKYKAELDDVAFRIGNLRSQVEQFLVAQERSAALFDHAPGAARVSAQALQGLEAAAEGRGSPATDPEKARALAAAHKILAGQARDTAAALDIETAGVVRLAEAQGKGTAAIREVEKALKIEAEVRKVGEANRATVTGAIEREFEARKKLASATFDAAIDKRIVAAARLAEAQLKGAAAVAEANIQNKVAEQVAAEGAENDAERVKQIEDRIRAEQRLQDLASKRDELSRMREELALAEKELELVNASVEVRTRELAIFQARQALARDGRARTQEEIDAYVDLAAKIAEVRLQTQRANEASDLWLEPFRNAIRGIQDAFAKAFESIFSGGVKSFGDLAKTVKGIMVQMAAQIAALMIFRPIVGNVLSGLGMSKDLIGSILPGFSGSSSSSSGGLGFTDIFGTLKNVFSAPGDFLTSMFPSLFGMAPTALGASIGISGGLGGIAAEAMLLPELAGVGATGAFGPLAGMAGPIGIALALAPLLFSMFGKKPSVGPGGGVNLEMKDGRYEIASGEQDNGFNWRETAKPWGEAVADAFEAIVEDLGATVVDAANLGVGFDAGKKKHYASFSKDGEYERQWFDTIEEAVAAAVKYGLTKGDIDGLDPRVQKALRNTDAKDLQSLRADIAVADSFQDTVDIFNAGIGSMTEQAIAFRKAADQAAKAEADRIESWLKDIDRLLGNRDRTTRTEKVSLSGLQNTGENDQSQQFSDDDGNAYTVVGTTDKGNMRLVNNATGEFVEAIRDATTGLYHFERQVSDTTISDTPSEEQKAAREAAKNRALSFIGLGPEVVKPLTGWSAEMAKWKASIEAATPVLKAAGFTAEEAAAKIAEAWTKKLGELRDDYDKDSRRRLNAARGFGAINSLDDLVKGRESELKDIASLYSSSADQTRYTERANEIFNATVRQTLSGLGEDGLQAVIDEYKDKTDDASKAIVAQARASLRRVVQWAADAVTPENLQVGIVRWANEAANAERALAEARQTALDLVGQEVERTRSLVQAYRQIGDTLGSYSKSLLLNRELSPLSQRQRLDEAERQFEEIAAKAMGGDVGAMEELQGISQAYLEAARDYYASSTDYFDRFQRVQQVLTNTESIAQREARNQEIALATAEQQLRQITGVEQNTKSIAEAMADFLGAQKTAEDTSGRISGEQWSAFQALASNFSRDYGNESSAEGRQAVYDRYAPMRDALLNAIDDVELLQRIGQTYYRGNSSDSGSILLRSLIYAKGKIPAFALGGVAEGLFLAGEHGPELLYSGAPTRVFDHDASKRLISGNDNVASERVVVAIDRGSRAVVDSIIGLQKTTADGFARVASAVADNARSIDRLANQVRGLIAA